MPVPDLRITRPNGVAAAQGGSGADDIARLRADVEETRNRLGSSLAELERRVSLTAGWRRWAKAHPLAVLAIGLGAGYLVGRLGGAPKRPA